MNHLAIIQSEFVKEARKWKDMPLEFQRAYLKRHPKSKRRLTPSAISRGNTPNEEISNRLKRIEKKTRNEMLFNKFVHNMEGKKVEAFGSSSHGMWGGSDEKQEYRISKIKLEPHEDLGDPDNDDNYAHIRVYLDGYRPSKTGLIYTDPKFLKSIRDIMEKKGYKRNSLDYTEQGMQGNNYVSMGLFLGRYKDAGNKGWPSKNPPLGGKEWERKELKRLKDKI